MSLMSALYVGRSGLQVSQNALNTTAHNISNADTAGYVRQQVLQGDYPYNTIKLTANAISNQQLGLGVMYTSTRQVRDAFLDELYRKESGRSAFYEVSYTTLTEIENVLGEVTNSSFKDTIERFWSSVQELAKQPDDAVNQALFIQRADLFLTEATAIYDELSSYQDNLNTQVADTVAKINQYGNAISELNKQILKIEVGDVENANDLRDQRNYYLDQLGELCNISYTTDYFGNVIVRIEEEDFVTAERVYEMGLLTEANGFYTPYWPQLAEEKMNSYGEVELDITYAKVVDTSRPISSELDTDVGKLEGLVFARGDHRANYTDMAEDKYDGISDSLMMNIQAEFDQLIHNIVTAVNGVLADAADPDTGYLCNADGSPIQVFEKISSESYIYNETSGEWEKVEENPDKTESLFTLGNMIINQDLVKQPALLSFVKGEDSVDFETAAKLAAAFDSEEYTLNPNLETPANFFDYYINLMNQVSGNGNVYKSLLDKQEASVASVEEARQQIMGVSTDEELTNMIRFQNAYNASSRYINAVNELLENLLGMMR